MIGLRTGASGLKAYGEAMEVVGSNIANVNTVGYKNNRTNFQDMLSTNIRGTHDRIGKGVMISSVQKDFSTGNMESSTQNTDLAIDGDGFFTIKDEFNRIFYTRAGNFEFNKKGELVTVNEENILGRVIDETTNRASGEPEPITVLGIMDPPKATGDGANGTGINLMLNLDNTVQAPEVQFDPTNVVSSMYNYISAATVIDERGGEHVVNVAYRKVPDTPPTVDPTTGQTTPGVANQWEWYFVVNAKDVGGESSRQIAIGGGFLQFDENGRLLSTTNGAFTAPGPAQIGPTGELIPPGPPVLVPRPLAQDSKVPQVTAFFTNNPQTIGINFGDGYNPNDPNDERTGLDGVTAFDSEFSISNITADGQRPGKLETFDINSSGVINGMFDNGTTKPLYQLTLNRFINNQGLLRMGENRFRETIDSGTPIAGAGNEKSFGSIRSKNLEKSNVDLSLEFVRMIETQRAFQANAKIITTGDEMTAEVVNMKR